MRSILFRPSLCQLLSLLLFLFAAISAVAIGVLWTTSVWNREVQTVQDQHLQLAHHLAEGLARYAEDVEAVFQLAVLNMAQHQPTPNLTTLLRRLHFKHICLVNSTGEIEQLLAPAPIPQIKHIPERLLTQLKMGQAGANDLPSLSNVLPDRRGKPTLYLWHRLNQDRYALGALETTYFVQLQRTISFGQKGHAAIVDRSGSVIAHPNPQWQATMKDISALDPVRRMRAGETGVSWFFSPAVQAPMVAGFTTTPKTGWGVMVPQPVSELQARVGDVKRIIWSVVGAILLGSAILGWLVSRWLAVPLNRIGATAERFASGSDTARVSDLGTIQTREAAGLATQFNAMADEVTQSWQARRDSEERFREFAQIAADWFWETDLHQVFTYLSPISQSSCRLDAQDILGRHRREFVLKDPQETITMFIQSAMDREASFDDVRLSTIGRDRLSLQVALSGRPMRAADGKVMGYRGVTRDITEQLRAETQLRQAQKEEEMRQAQKMEAIGTLAGGIAHDFNNILGIMLGYTDLSLRTVPPQSQIGDYLQQVLTAGKRAKSMVQQILTFSRNNEPERQPMRLHQVVNEALLFLRASLPSTITIHQDFAADGRDVVLADTTQIHQVLMNLCTNAEYAMRERGGMLDVDIDTVQVDTTFIAQHPELQPGSYVRLTIRDTGQGMEADVVERIFEPYFTTKEVGDGTGMGLAVAHGIIASHGGTITVQSAPEKGTAVAIYLPQIEAEVDHEAAPESPLPRGEGAVLFVDDEEMLCRLAHDMLKKLGYDVVVKTSSLEALRTFRARPHHFDLVITDQTMPIMTGAMLAHELRKIRLDIPLILCTGFSHNIDAEKAAAQDIDAFCMKPLVTHELGLVMRKVLARPITKPV